MFGQVCPVWSSLVNLVMKLQFDQKYHIKVAEIVKQPIKLITLVVTNTMHAMCKTGMCITESILLILNHYSLPPNTCLDNLQNLSRQVLGGNE